MRPALAALAMLFIARPALAQHAHGDPAPSSSSSSPSCSSASPSSPSSPSCSYDATPHLRVTPARMGSSADSARGDSIVTLARAAVARYASVAAAEEDGYAVRLKIMRQPKVLHYTNLRNGFAARTTFDPARPTSLLYERSANGDLKLIGVMYTAPASLSLDDLDARVPLSLVQWHLHTNVCVPRGPAARDAANYIGRNAKFGPRGSISNEKDCADAGGRFRAQSFGWMVHINVMTDDPWEPGQKHMH